MLHPFQRRMLTDYFDGVTETLILLSKKNGKSSLLAALALHHLLVTPDAECVIAAASRDQAQILLNQARGYVRRSTLGKYMTVKQREIVSLRDEGRVRVLASDSQTADGVIPTLAIVDELHRHKDDGAMYGVFHDGLGPRKGRIVTISTAGDNMVSPLGRLREAAYLQRVQRKDAYRYVRQPDFAMHEWALDDGADTDDMNVVKLANPAPWQTVEALAKRHGSPSMTPKRWARFACGQWVSSEESAIGSADWADCPILPLLEDFDTTVAIDLGWVRDTTAIVPVQAHSATDVRLGKPSIIEPPGDGTATRENVILDAVTAMKQRWRVSTVVIDPEAGGRALVEKLEDGYHADDGEWVHLGLSVVTHSQKPEPMIDAATKFAAAVRNRHLSHPHLPVLTRHVLAAAAKSQGDEERFRFVKRKRNPEVIDGCIAAAMGVRVSLSTLLEPAPAPLVEVW